MRCFLPFPKRVFRCARFWRSTASSPLSPPSINPYNLSTRQRVEQLVSTMKTSEQALTLPPLPLNKNVRVKTVVPEVFDVSMETRDGASPASIPFSQLLRQWPPPSTAVKLQLTILTTALMTTTMLTISRQVLPRPRFSSAHRGGQVLSTSRCPFESWAATGLFPSSTSIIS